MENKGATDVDEIRKERLVNNCGQNSESERGTFNVEYGVSYR